jgi:protein-S-isoprenylcysteine O-methyltransferase Ste14
MMTEQRALSRRKLIERLRRARVGASFVFVLLGVMVSRPTIASVLLGASLAFVGLIIRAWASGYLRKDRLLVQSGPYALTRNPLYVGSLIAGIGFCLACGRMSLLLWFFVFFGVFYYPAMLAEREHLRALFGPAYDRYERAVPLFLPRLRRSPRVTGENPSVAPGPPVATAQPSRFAFALYLENREYRALVGFALVCVLLLVKAL